MRWKNRIANYINPGCCFLFLALLFAHLHENALSLYLSLFFFTDVKLSSHLLTKYNTKNDILHLVHCYTPLDTVTTGLDSGLMVYVPTDAEKESVKQVHPQSMPLFQYKLYFCIYIYTCVCVCASAFNLKTCHHNMYLGQGLGGKSEKERKGEGEGEGEGEK